MDIMEIVFSRFLQYYHDSVFHGNSSFPRNQDVKAEGEGEGGLRRPPSGGWRFAVCGRPPVSG